MRKIDTYGPSLIVLATAATVLVAGPTAIDRITHSHTTARVRQAEHRLGDEDGVLAQINQAYQDIASVVEPSVVHISTETWVQNRFGKRARRASSGSGWIYDDAGHIVTNFHVIEDAMNIEVQLHTGAIRKAEIVGSDPSTDVAVLRIPPANIIPAARRAKGAGQVRQGDLVFAFGSPFDFRFSMSSGVVSGKGRSVGVITNGRGRNAGYENFIQVDAAINPGNSGGPLTNYRGQVIGMNTAIATGRRDDRLEDGQFAGIGLAIPIEMIEPVVDQLIESGVVAKGFLGVGVVDATNTLIQELEQIAYNGRNPGVFVGAIAPGSPIAEAGLRYGDVIQHVQGQWVEDVRQIERAIDALDANDSCKLLVWRYDDRAGRGDVITVELSPSEARALPGVEMLRFDDEVGDAFDLMGFGGRGVRIASFLPGGPAATSGLRRGDIIRRVNGLDVGTVQQLRSMISTMLPGEEVELAVWRFDPASTDSTAMTISLPLGELDPIVTSGVLPFDQSLEHVRAVGIERMMTSNPTVAESMNIRFNPGVVVIEVVRDSRAARERLLVPGTTIVEVNARMVTSVEDFVSLLQDANLGPAAGVPVQVIYPNGASATVHLTIDQ